MKEPGLRRLGEDAVVRENSRNPTPQWAIDGKPKESINEQPSSTLSQKSRLTPSAPYPVSPPIQMPSASPTTSRSPQNENTSTSSPVPSPSRAPKRRRSSRDCDDRRSIIGALDVAAGIFWDICNFEYVIMKLFFQLPVILFYRRTFKTSQWNTQFFLLLKKQVVLLMLTIAEAL